MRNPPRVKPEMLIKSWQMILTGLTLATFLAAGCRPQQEKDEIAPVSGTVYLDGKPLENVKVFFVPVKRGKDGNQGPIAFGETDAKGHYTLAHHDDGVGAAIGRNQVWLTTRCVERKKDSEGEFQTIETKEELIPPKYNKSTELVVDVPEEGMNNADFDLKSASSP